MLTTVQICALIALFLFIGITYWAGYRGGLIDGQKEGYGQGHTAGLLEGKREAEVSGSAALEQSTDRCKRLQFLLDLQPKDRQTLLAIAEKLQLAADTFRAVRSESQATQTLALREKVLSMADPMMDQLDIEHRRKAA